MKENWNAYQGPRDLVPTSSGTTYRFQSPGRLSLPARAPFKMQIRGTVTKLGEGEFEHDIVYNFRVNPLARDKRGDDRVFAFQMYSKAQNRNTPKHSKERHEIARKLRIHHSKLWQRFHDAMDLD